MELKPLRSLETYLQSLVEAKLWVKVVIALILGVLVGFALSPEVGWITASLSSAIGGWLALPGKLFLKLVQMIMIPLIFASIITGLSGIGNDQLKKMGLGVGLYFIITTVVSITLGVFLAMVIKPGMYMQVQSLPGNSQEPDDQLNNGLLNMQDIPGAISGLLPENPLASMVSGEMLAIVIFTVIIGVAIIQLNQRHKEPIMHLLSAIQEICMTIVRWAMRLVPYAVFGLMAQLTSSIGISSLQGIGLYIATVLAGLFVLLLLYLALVGIIGKQNPLTFLKNIREVQLLAFSTTSSAAVMPLSIKTAQEKLGINKGISNFLIPIGATINMDGTALYQCISTIFIAQVYGLEMTMTSIILIMFTIVAASIGTPAIPGGGVIILASVLQSAGIPVDGIVLIIGVERILGMFRSAINVTGDLTACTIFQRFELRAESKT